MSSLAAIALPQKTQITTEAGNENKRVEEASVEQRSQNCFSRIDFHESTLDVTANSKAPRKPCIVLTKPLLPTYKFTLEANKTPTYQSPIVRPKVPGPESQQEEGLDPLLLQ